MQLPADTQFGAGEPPVHCPPAMIFASAARAPSMSIACRARECRAAQSRQQISAARDLYRGADFVEATEQ